MLHLTVERLKELNACDKAIQAFVSYFGGESAQIEWSEESQHKFMDSPLKEFMLWAVANQFVPALTIDYDPLIRLKYKHMFEPNGSIKRKHLGHYDILARAVKGSVEKQTNRPIGLRVNGDDCCDDNSVMTAAQGLTLNLPDISQHTLTPLSVRRYDAATLGSTGDAFNASVMPWRGRELMAWRQHQVGSVIKLTDLATMQTWPMNLDDDACRNGREDPRLAIVAGKLYVVFTGVSAKRRTSVIYANIVETADGFAVGRVFAPDYAARTRHEKNWSMFDYGGKIHAVYSVTPHRVLAIDGSNATLAYETPWHGKFESGEPRGGASPILVDGEFWSFAHTIRMADRQYCTIAYTFDAKPPFAPRRYAKWPIVVPTPEGKPETERNLATYCCGSYYDESRREFVISSGEHNAFATVKRFKREDLEQLLENVQ